MYRVDLANVTQIDRLWPFVYDGLENACQKTGGDITADSLWVECRSGKAYLIVIAAEKKIVGASVWRFEQWTSGKKFRCLALYGHDFKGWWAEHYRLLETMMKAGGATAFVWEARKGFERIAPESKVLRQLYETPFPWNGKFGMEQADER